MKRRKAGCGLVAAALAAGGHPGAVGGQTPAAPAPPSGHGHGRPTNPTRLTGGTLATRRPTADGHSHLAAAKPRSGRIPTRWTTARSR